MPRPNAHKPPSVEEVKDEVYLSGVLLNCKRRQDVKTDVSFKDENGKPTVTYDKFNQDIITIRAPSGQTKTYERIAEALPDTNDSFAKQHLNRGILSWGFKASAFAELDEKSKPNGNVRYVFPGIWQPRDFTAALLTGTGLTNSPQVAQVKDFSQLVDKELEKRNIEPKEAHITGHSLGSQNAIAMHRRLLTGSDAPQLPANDVKTTLIDAYGARVGLRHEASNMVEDKAPQILSVSRQAVVQALQAAKWVTDNIAKVIPPVKKISQLLEDIQPPEIIKDRARRYREALNLTRTITSISANSFLKRYPDGISAHRENSEEAIGANAYRISPAETPITEEQKHLQKAAFHESNVIASEMYKPKSQLIDQHDKSIPKQMQAPDIKDVINQEKALLPALWANVVQRTISATIDNFKHQRQRTHKANETILEEHQLELNGIDKALSKIHNASKVIKDTLLENAGSYREQPEPTEFVAQKVEKSDKEQRALLLDVIEKFTDDGVTKDDPTLQLLTKSYVDSIRDKRAPAKVIEEILEQRKEGNKPSSSGISI